MKAKLASEVCEAYRTSFEETRAERAELPAWLDGTRSEALAAFFAQGWPSTHEEEWRFTDVAPIATGDFGPKFDEKPGTQQGSFDQALLDLGAGDGHRLVFLDGAYAPTFSSWLPTPAGLTVAPLSSPLLRESTSLRQVLGQHLQTQNAFVALNTAFFTDGAFLHIPAGFTSKIPIYLVYLSSGAGAGKSHHTRTVVLAEEGSVATLIEIHLGASHAIYLANATTEILLERHAELSWHSIQKGSSAGFHIGHTAVTQKADSHLSAHSLVLDGRIVRNDVHVRLVEERCACELDGIYLTSGKGHVDNHTTVDHRAPAGKSRENYKGVLTGTSRAVFDGRIIVRPGAQQTDARQTNRNLLLSEGAQVNTKPHLEIFADDVKCAHGATIGRLDAEALFYLRSRGLAEIEASQLLIRAFLTDGLDRILPVTLRQELEKILMHRIDSGTTTGSSSHGNDVGE